MISSEVQRTLVKSPPELWAELSDPDALARHFGELGEIRITRVQAEEKVEWEAPGATGTILLKASGWGTRVTLSVSHELAAPEMSEPEPAPEAALPDPAAETPDGADASAVPVAPDPEPEAADDVSTPEAEASAPAEPVEAEPVAADPSAAAPAEEQPAPEQPPAWAPPPRAPQRRGFFARFMFFLRGPEHAPQDEPPAPAPAAEPAPAESPEAATVPPTEISEDPEIALAEETAQEAPSLQAAQEHAPAEASAEEPAPAVSGGETVLEKPQNTTDQSPDAGAQKLAEELRAAEEIAAEHVTAILTSVLDRLGAAHHRPFSRA